MLYARPASAFLQSAAIQVGARCLHLVERISVNIQTINTDIKTYKIHSNGLMLSSVFSRQTVSHNFDLNLHKNFILIWSVLIDSSSCLTYAGASSAAGSSFKWERFLGLLK